MLSDFKFYASWSFIVGNCLIAQYSFKHKRGDPSFFSLGHVETISMLFLALPFIYYSCKQSQHNNLQVSQEDMELGISSEEEEGTEGIGFPIGNPRTSSLQGAFLGGALGAISSVALAILYIKSYQWAYATP